MVNTSVKYAEMVISDADFLEGLGADFEDYMIQRLRHINLEGEDDEVLFCRRELIMRWLQGRTYANKQSTGADEERLVTVVEFCDVPPEFQGWLRSSPDLLGVLPRRVEMAFRKKLDIPVFDRELRNENVHKPNYAFSTSDRLKAFCVGISRYSTTGLEKKLLNLIYDTGWQRKDELMPEFKATLASYYLNKAASSPQFSSSLKILLDPLDRLAYEQNPDDKPVCNDIKNLLSESPHIRGLVALNSLPVLVKGIFEKWSQIQYHLTPNYFMKQGLAVEKVYGEKPGYILFVPYDVLQDQPTLITAYSAIQGNIVNVNIKYSDINPLIDSKSTSKREKRKREKMCERKKRSAV